MEIIAAAFAVGLLIWYLEKRDRAFLFPDQQCRHCHRMVHLRRHTWVHDDGSVWAPWPNMPDVKGLPPAPFHPAIPSIFATPPDLLSEEEETQSSYLS
jgi:hypothetical protein